MMNLKDIVKPIGTGILAGMLLATPVHAEEGKSFIGKYGRFITIHLFQRENKLLALEFDTNNDGFGDFKIIYQIGKAMFDIKDYRIIAGKMMGYAQDKNFDGDYEDEGELVMLDGI